MRYRQSCCFVLALLICSAVPLVESASATTYVVRPDGGGDFPTIQEALDSADFGDIIELADGTFTGPGNRNINFLGKAVTVRSVSGDPATCIIDCEGGGRGFLFVTGEDYASVLEGVTITQASTWPAEAPGGGVYCAASSPSLTNLVIRYCSARGGGGMYTWDCSPHLTDVTFYQNNAYGPADGGGLLCSGGAPVLERVGFHDNYALSGIPHAPFPYGGGMYCSDSHPTLVHVTFDGNCAASGGGMGYSGGNPHLTNVTFSRNYIGYGYGGGLFCASGAAILTNVTFWHNSSSGIWCGDSTVQIESTIIAHTTGPAVAGPSYDPSDVTLSCSDIFGNTGGDWIGPIAGQNGINGNIQLDPLFCGEWEGDFTLHDNSPCVPFSPPNSECDLIGAWPVGCGPSTVEQMSWGSIKAMYR